MEWKDSLTLARIDDAKNKDSLLPTLAKPLFKKLMIHLSKALCSTISVISTMYW